MSKPAFYNLMTPRAFAFLDKVAYKLFARRMFTYIVTDETLRTTILNARSARGHNGVISSDLARKAAAARKTLRA